MLVAIKIQNPQAVAKRFGECAGDYRPDECQFWAGDEQHPDPFISGLFPVAEVPEGAMLLPEDTKVKICGGSAWLA